MGRLLHLWEYLRTSLWFVPALIVAGAVVLAMAMIESETWLGLGREVLTQRWPRLFGVGAEGSRGLLSSIAGSMITVAGVTFSITVVALTLASSQYSPRILRNFMRDRLNQSVLGVFLGVFAYCLVVLRTIRGGDEGLFVPALAVFVAMLLAFVAIGFLIFFIHHVAASIQAASIIEAAAVETLEAVDRMHPEAAAEVAGARRPADGDDDEEDDVTVPDSDAHADPKAPTEAAAERYAADAAMLAGIYQWHPVPARRSGYVQRVDVDALLSLARNDSLLVRMKRGPGEFVTEGAPLALVALPIAEVPDAEAAAAAAHSVDAAYTMGRQRTLEQDVSYGIRQIVDVALKALSPGINDTSTAINCLDYLGAILARLAPRPIEGRWRSDAGRRLVFVRRLDFPQLLALACNQIRQNAAGNVAVLAQLLNMLETLATLTSDPRRRDALRLQAQLVDEVAERTIPAEHDQAAVAAARRRFDRAMEEGPTRPVQA